MKEITEKDGLQKKWYAEANEIKTREALDKFITKLTTEYNHDYGTICHAVAAAALAAAHVVDASPQGGITGFQASCIMWEFIRNWDSGIYQGAPLRMVNYRDLLYPQYEYRFTEISQEIWEWVQEKAKNELRNTKSVCDNVKNHWKTIANGTVPFGLRVKQEDK